MSDVVARADECDADALCAASPCTIAGRHALGESCTLDFSGKDVTIAPDGRIVSRHPFDEITIHARNLTVRGAIDVVGATLTIEVERDLNVESGGGLGGRLYDRVATQTENGTPVQSDSGIYVTAGGGARLDGDLVLVSGGTGTLRVDAGEIEVGSRVAVHQHAENAQSGVFLTAAQGAIRTRGRITSLGHSENCASTIVMIAEDRVEVGGRLETSASNVSLLARRGDVLLAGDVRADSWHHATPYLEIEAGKDIELRGRVSSRGLGPHAISAGYVSLTPGPSGNVRIDKRIDVRGVSAAGGIVIQPACDVTIGGTLIVAADDGTGAVELTYRRTLDLSGATIRSGREEKPAAGGKLSHGCVDADGDHVCDPGSRHTGAVTGYNHFVCRCTEREGACEGACALPPKGLDTATIEPTPMLHPSPLAACD